MRGSVVRWLSRILAFAFVVFLSLFAADVFSEFQGAAAILPLFMHLLPSLALVVVIIIAWKYELVGAIVFLLGAIGYVWMVGLGRPWSWYVAISGPALVVALLYYISWWQHREQVHTKTAA